jgi:hypothetical protein
MAQFRKMQRGYRPQDFDIWASRLRQIQPGMTRKQVLSILWPKQVSAQLTSGGTTCDIFDLSDAYFAFVEVSGSWPHRVLGVTPPLALTYEIVSPEKAPKT